MTGSEKLLLAFFPVVLAVGTYANAMAYHGLTPAQASRASWSVFRIMCMGVVTGWAVTLILNA